MRGIDGWSTLELRALPRAWVQPLLDLFARVVALRQWPRQLAVWLLILLRKTDTVVPTWDLLRPISVASLPYRIWSRMYTKRMMTHAVQLSLPFISPRLSTRALWGWLAETIASRYRSRSPLYGLVLDIIKCFNVVPRSILFSILSRLGFDANGLAGWSAQLSGLERTVYVDTQVVGTSQSSTGIPEGDPLSVIGMFGLSLAFGHYITRHSVTLPLAFADNWEILAVSRAHFEAAVPTVEQFLTLCRLPVNPRKCWSWAITAGGRRTEASFFLSQLQVNGRYRGPAARLVQVLAELGWDHTPAGVFVDRHGRTFHVILSPWRHVQRLLLSSWSEEGARRTCHRRYLHGLETIDLSLSRAHSHLPLADRKLLPQQLSGTFYTGEFLKHGTTHSGLCRFCGAQDTRLHRVLHCPRVQQWKSQFPMLEQAQDAIPEHTWAHGIWEEPPLWRSWQAYLDSLTLPEPIQVDNPQPVVIYSDGSCLRPKCPHTALAAAAILCAAPDGSFTIPWCGPLPGSLQTPYRAEVLAGAVAFSSYRRLHLFSDCVAFVRVATRLLASLSSGQQPILPSEHRDLWGMLLLGMQRCDHTHCTVQWVKAHRDYRHLTGMAKVHAWFNQWVDRAANGAARACATPLYHDLVSQVSLLARAATSMASYQAGVARVFANEHIEDPAPPSLYTQPLVFQDLVSAPCQELDYSGTPSPTFSRSLHRWLTSLQWSSFALDPSQATTWTDTSWLELFWSHVCALASALQSARRLSALHLPLTINL
eukprot:Skav217434  [mRNA]  locus=scaffold1729:263093:266058:+ [translate_table: standard]